MWISLNRTRWMVIHYFPFNFNLPSRFSLSLFTPWALYIWILPLCSIPFSSLFKWSSFFSTLNFSFNHKPRFSKAFFRHLKTDHRLAESNHWLGIKYFWGNMIWAELNFWFCFTNRATTEISLQLGETLKLVSVKCMIDHIGLEPGACQLHMYVSGLKYEPTEFVARKSIPL